MVSTESTMKRSNDNQLDVSIAVPFRYPVIFTHDLFNGDNRIVADWVASLSQQLPARFMVVVDSGLAAAHPGLTAGIKHYAARHEEVLSLAGEPLILPGGEDGKNNFDNALRIIRLARQLHLCRQSYLMALGGGAFLDVAGFAASMIHRGVRLVRIPTTVLSQNDSGVGVKNGLNLRGAKNFLGTFAPPAAVFNDFSFLNTLNQRDWVAGIAEAFKVAIIKDIGFLNWLLGHAELLRNRDEQAMERLIRRCAELHVTHIATSGDPFEFGSARPLDFGHWAAHKLESLSMHELKHGEAVAIGMAIDLLYAASLGYISDDDAVRVIAGLRRAGLPVWHEALEIAGPDGNLLVLCGIEEFREHLGGDLQVTLPAPLGAKREVQTLDQKRLTACIAVLRRIASSSVTAAQFTLK
jgi:3-dehydroquinate synthase